MTVKQEGPLPTPRSSNKSTSQSENKDNPDEKVESKEKQPVASSDTPPSGKDDVFNHSLAEGFIYMWGMSNKIWAELNSKIKD